MTKKDNVSQYLSHFVMEDELVQQYAKKGCCRLWAKEALELLKKKLPNDVSIEAREVVTTGFIDHTFLRIEKDGEVYILDGTGVENSPPYFGLERDAGLLYQKSHADIINYY